MSMIDRVFAEAEMRDDPPVLVDVGAAGGVHAPWRRIARHCIGVGFDGDTRETAALSRAHQMFRRWVFIPGLAAATAPADGKLPFHLTRSPQCSSLLRPDAAGLAEWAFADIFSVTEQRPVAAGTLEAGLQRHRLGRIDWLKCDTQGTDLRLFLSLPEAWRHRTLLIEMEPGLIDAYEGEDRLGEVLERMRPEPFWLAGFDVQKTARGRPGLLEAHLGEGGAARYRRLTRTAPGWANLAYLRDFARQPDVLDRRAHLLGWVFATLTAQPAAALAIAEAGMRAGHGEFFCELAAASVRTIRRGVWLGFLRAALRRLRGK
jgi:hypothetical protein